MRRSIWIFSVFTALVLVLAYTAPEDDASPPQRQVASDSIWPRLEASETKQVSGGTADPPLIIESVEPDKI
jgi:hypothetical protein